MISYILAENLKHKGTFLKKLLVIMPLSLILLSLFLMPSYFTTNAYNWWYVIIMPATFALIPAMMHRKEDRRLKYRAVFPLNIKLEKLWVSKIITAFVYMSIAAMVHMLGVYIFQFLIGGQLAPNYGFSILVFASFLLIISNIWQIPLCFFLAKKFGFIASITINSVLGLALGILLSDSTFWIYCPYSWGIRLMIPVMHILPSGVLIEASNPMAANTSLLIPCILSICLFTLLTMISAKWFSNQEVK